MQLQVVQYLSSSAGDWNRESVKKETLTRYRATIKPLVYSSS
jgi:hypothetical protein